MEKKAKIILKQQRQGAGTGHAPDFGESGGLLADDELDLLNEEEVRPKRPNMYCVLMLNDEYTPMDFVVWVIQRVFHKSLEDSTRLMLDVHNKGRGLMGVFTHDVGLTKLEQVHVLAEQDQHPLQCILEAEEGDE